MRVVILLAATLASLSCVPRQAMLPEPPAAVEVEPATPPLGPPVRITRADSAWREVLRTVTPLAQKGAYESADSLLAHFAGDHDGTCQAAEARYLRALFLLSPGNASAAPRKALPLLDSYLSSTCLQPYRSTEIEVMRTMALDLDRVASNGDSSTAATIRKLQEQLDQTNKELARLKMRVIPPGR
jgi:hypothetical protein